MLGGRGSWALAMAALLLAACGGQGSQGAAPDRPSPSGTGDDQTFLACTQIGCESAITFLVPHDLVAEESYEVEACVGVRCSTETLEVPAPAHGPYVGVDAGDITLMIDTDRVLLRLPEQDWSGTHEVSLVVRDASGTILTDAETETDFERQQPNGPDCPPTCWFAEVAI